MEYLQPWAFLETERKLSVDQVERLVALGVEQNLPEQYQLDSEDPDKGAVTRERDSFGRLVLDKRTLCGQTPLRYEYKCTLTLRRFVRHVPPTTESLYAAHASRGKEAVAPPPDAETARISERQSEPAADSTGGAFSLFDRRLNC